jgi:hypothetical protein
MSLNPADMIETIVDELVSGELADRFNALQIQRIAPEACSWTTTTGGACAVTLWRPTSEPRSLCGSSGYRWTHSALCPTSSLQRWHRRCSRRRPKATSWLRSSTVSVRSARVASGPWHAPAIRIRATCWQRSTYRRSCLFADHDVRAPGSIVEAMHRAVPGSELVVLTGPGHISTVETPEESPANCAASCVRSSVRPPDDRSARYRSSGRCGYSRRNDAGVDAVRTSCHADERSSAHPMSLDEPLTYQHAPHHNHRHPGHLRRCPRRTRPGAEHTFGGVPERQVEEGAGQCMNHRRHNPADRSFDKFTVTASAAVGAPM